MHMVLHLGLVLVAAPLLALGLARMAATREMRFGVLAALGFSLVEMLVVWAWHIPALHAAAALRPDAFVLQQATFLLAGLLVWLPGLGSGRGAAAAGTAALVASFVHMTMLGVLLALAPEPIYPAEVCGGALGLNPLADQRAGGALMAVTGGFAYLCGAIWQLARLIDPPAAPGKV
jgi:putative membrane protein